MPDGKANSYLITVSLDKLKYVIHYLRSVGATVTAVRDVSDRLI